jgi:cyclohexyl-isocyanide hydratase
MAEGAKPVRIAMVLFPNLTVLDLVGPYETLNVPQAKIDLVWHRIESVPAQGGLCLVPTATFAEYGPADVLFVPGGAGQLAAMDDGPLIEFVRRCAAGAKYVTSVCTGSLVLAAAGLLKGKRATCHWASADQLALMGAIPVKERVVEDGNIVTGGGVTSGIDFGLVLAARLWGEETAKAIQLRLEYDPAPPFDSGSPETADPALVSQVRTRMAPLTERRIAAARRIGKERLGL